jgi:tetratricopeptide (TPR) repeat protein
MVEGLGDIDSMDWPAPIYKEVAEIFQQRMELQDVPTPIKDMGVVLWFQFCQKKKKRIQNPNLYVAALHYLVSSIAPTEDWYTQKELADIYDVSLRTFSSIYREMDDVLSEEISELLGIIEDDLEFPLVPHTPVTQFNQQKEPRVMQEVLAELEGINFENIDEITQFMNKKLNTSSSKKGPKGKKEQAQQLIYEALEAEGKERYKLAEEALRLNSNCVDAYVILAEKAASQGEALLLYEKGMQVGEKELGKAFFNDNKGHFWGIHETRPFMRAKLHYADVLYLLGKIKEATQQFEEILELNPHDNQGARYALFVAYIDNGEFIKARKLLKKYDEGTAHGFYNKLLLEIYEKGFSEKAAKLLKEAKKQNKQVLAFLTGKKRLPKHTPDYYGFGDENEAIVYADMHLHLWKKIEGLQEWLKNHK